MSKKNCEKIIVELVVNIFKEDSRYIADCPALALSTHGRSLSQAQKNFEEALSLWLQTTMKEGLLRDALKSLGWKMGKYPTPGEREMDFRKVPISLLKQKSYPVRLPEYAVS